MKINIFLKMAHGMTFLNIMDVAKAEIEKKNEIDYCSI